MKKVSLALSILFAVGLTACSSNSGKDQNAYKGQILFSEMQGDDLKLTIIKNDCSYKYENVEREVLTHAYDSSLVVGACVKVSDDGKGLKNISKWSPRNPI
ncbi:hypothetical protein [Rodentibacter caecimuris]|uniref:Lipoprotein n=1 Tax=Rodentibacter caecimuris TaxID=1796644 RepID=A0ABX3KYI0_9PAST|nr:hypothetical protein BKG89_03265 [Rodentibacter heylii]